MKDKLLEELKRNHEYWHITNCGSFQKILRDGNLRAMTESESTFNFKTAARYLNGVSLFDFNSPEFNHAETHHGGHHWDFFNRPPFAIAIGIDPNRLTGTVLAYPENRDLTDMATTGQLLQMPLLIEVIHIGPIPLTAWTRLLRVEPSLLFQSISGSSEEKMAMESHLDY